MWNIACVVHGDDFTALGTADSLDLYEAEMCKAFECKLKGRLGHQPEDLKEIRVLNRVVTIVEAGLKYEPDPGMWNFSSGPLVSRTPSNQQPLATRSHMMRSFLPAATPTIFKTSLPPSACTRRSTRR